MADGDLLPNATLLPALAPRFTAPPAAGLEEGVGTPLWWLYRLLTRLKIEQPMLILLDDYYSGDHPLPELRDEKVRAEFYRYLARSKSNFMRLVVDAQAQRTRLQGFRLADATTSADKATWDLFEQNDMESELQIAWQVMLTQRRAYVSVWYPPQRSSSTTPVIRIEDPTQTIVEYEPGDRTKRAAALKVWVDDWTGDMLANVYLPTAIHKFRFEQASRVRPFTAWVEREPAQRNPLGVVPVFPLVNRPRLSRNGMSEIEDLLVIQDRINQTILGRQIAEHHAAFRQKWATGLEIPVDEDTGEPIQTFKSAIDTFWVNEDPTGKWGQFEAADLSNYGAPKESDIQDIAVISATPRHYFTVNGQAPSGDSMKSAETGLVAKVIDQTRTLKSAVREIAMVARQIAALPAVMVDPIWGDPEYQTLGQLVDAQMKLFAGGIVSEDYVLEKIGETPATIDRERKARRTRQLAAIASAPTISVAPAPTSPVA